MTLFSFGNAQENIAQINKVETSVAEFASKFGPSARVFAHSGTYQNYKTMEIITEELLRNILLALLCVFLATLFLIANLFTSLLVVTSVVLTLVNVGGLMYFWGLTIDTSSALLLIIAMGLAVDYSAHVAHAFMVSPGNCRNQRIQNTMISMGPAVLNGGFSTFLAFAMLMTSASHVFLTFFKIFFLIVVFGLFNGLVVLPVILSFIGPSSTSDHAVAPAEKSGSARPSTAWTNEKNEKEIPKVKEEKAANVIANA